MTSTLIGTLKNEGLLAWCAEDDHTSYFVYSDYSRRLAATPLSNKTAICGFTIWT